MYHWKRTEEQSQKRSIWAESRVGGSGGEAKENVCGSVERGVKWSEKSRFGRPWFPKSVGGVVDVVEVSGGCPWRCGGRDGEPWRSLPNFTLCEEGETYSEEDTVTVVVRDRVVGGGAEGSWRNRIDVVESSVRETASKVCLGLRESGMVSTGRSAVGPEMLEVGFCAVIPRDRRTPVDVRL